MKVKYIGKTNVSLTNNKVQEVQAIESGMYRIVDDTDDDYLFESSKFEIVEEQKVLCISPIMKKVGKYIKEADHDKNMVFFNARKKVNENGNNNLNGPPEMVHRSTSQLDKEQIQLKRLYNLYADGNDTVLEMIKESESLVKTMKANVLSESKSIANMQKKEFVYENIKKLADVWDNIDKKKKNMILKTIIDKIVIVNGNIEIQLKNFQHKLNAVPMAYRKC